MEEAKNFITSLMVAASNCSLYTKEHDAFDDLAKKAYSKLSGIIEHSMDIMLIEDELIINKTPARDLGIHGMNLIKRLKRKGVSRINRIIRISKVELLT
jgi:hypothetical protein